MHQEQPTPSPVATTPAAAGARRDLYQGVTDKIIAQLEVGSVPSVQPWGRDHITPACGLPRNITTGRTYLRSRNMGQRHAQFGVSLHQNRARHGPSFFSVPAFKPHASSSRIGSWTNGKRN